MSLLSVVVLTCTLDDEIHQMNIHCLDSLFLSESWQEGQLEVILIESNKGCSWEYDRRVHVITPSEQFGFHHFLNIGLHNSSGEFVAFCNNDIIFTQGWFSAIKNVSDSHLEFLCFSPLDRNYPKMKEDCLPNSKDYYTGWENKKHFAGWCFVWKRKVFDIIGPFDERFGFYYADDDELQTLRSFAIPSVLVTDSEVKHLSQIVTTKEGKLNSHAITDREEYPLTEEEIKRGYSWLWEDDRFYKGYQTMKAKWGNERMIHRINRLLEKNKYLNIRFITRILYNKRINSILCYLTGIKQ